MTRVAVQIEAPAGSAETLTFVELPLAGGAAVSFGEVGVVVTYSIVGYRARAVMTGTS